MFDNVAKLRKEFGDLICCFRAQIVTRTASCIYVALVDAPGTTRKLRTIGVHFIREIVQRLDEAHLQIDVSNAQPPANSILHETRIHFPYPVHVDRYESDRRRSPVLRSRAVV